MTSRLLGSILGFHAYEHVLLPVALDANLELDEAIKAGNETQQRRIRLYTPLHLLIATAAYVLSRIVKRAKALRE